MINRRTFIKGASAAAVLPVIPALLIRKDPIEWQEFTVVWNRDPTLSMEYGWYVDNDEDHSGKFPIRMTIDAS